MVMWHVEDFKVYHKDPYQITNVSNYLSIIYGEKLTVKIGKVHDYLGTDLDYYEEVSVKVYMIKYKGKILISSLENIVVSSSSPDAEHLFKVRDDKEAKYLPEE